VVVLQSGELTGGHFGNVVTTETRAPPLRSRRAVSPMAGLVVSTRHAHFSTARTRRDLRTGRNRLWCTVCKRTSDDVKWRKRLARRGVGVPW